MLDRLDLKLLDILVMDDTLPYRTQLQPQIDDAQVLVRSSHGHIALCTTFDPYKFDHPSFGADAIKQIDRDFVQGAVAVKIWKNIGMEVRNAGGEYIMEMCIRDRFNLITGNMSASFGNAIGGVVNVITKSGTDQIHGDVFEFLRNSALDASDYFSGGLVNPLKQNQFGASIGGPIIKNRLFYFGSYQGTRLHTAQNGQIASVPNATERTGDFSDLLPGTQLINPATGANYNNNQIPVSPVSTYILNHIPLPNGSNDQLNFNGGPDIQNTYEYLAKVDFNFGKHHLSGHYFQMNYTDPVFIPPPTNLLELRGDAEHLVLKNISVVDIYTISPTFLLSSYFGYNSENGTTLSSAPFSMADAGVNMAVPENRGGGNSAVLNLTVGGDFLLQGVPYGAVSYTHLDVYKRQGRWCDWSGSGGGFDGYIRMSIGRIRSALLNRGGSGSFSQLLLPRGSGKVRDVGIFPVGNHDQVVSRSVIRTRAHRRRPRSGRGFIADRDYTLRGARTRSTSGAYRFVHHSESDRDVQSGLQPSCTRNYLGPGSEYDEKSNLQRNPGRARV